MAGGALFGFMYIRQLRSGTDMSINFFKFIDLLKSPFKKKPNMRVVRDEPKKRSVPSSSKKSAISSEEKQRKTDLILDKISKSGYDKPHRRRKGFPFPHKRSGLISLSLEVCSRGLQIIKFAAVIPNKRAAYHTLGCKLNFAETSTLARDLEESGYARVGFDERADVYVINTCSVTEQANRKCRNAVGRALRRNPEAKVVVVGCYAQLKPDEITKIPGVDLVLGASEKFKLAEHLENIEKNGSATAMVERISKAKDFFPSYSMGDRTRSFLKIQDGCDYFCAFCTIPLARGKSRNATVSETLEKAREVVAQGAKEDCAYRGEHRRLRTRKRGKFF